MKDIRAEIEKHGVIVLSDAWFAGGMAAKDKLHHEARRPEGHEVPRGRTDLRRDVAVGRREHREPAVQRDLQRVPERRGRTAPTRASAPSPRCASTRSPSASRRRATTRCGSCTSPCSCRRRASTASTPSSSRVILDAGKKAQAYYEAKADDREPRRGSRRSGAQRQGRDALAMPTTTRGSTVAKKSSYARFAKDVPERPEADRRGAVGQMPRAARGRPRATPVSASPRKAALGHLHPGRPLPLARRRRGRGAADRPRRARDLRHGDRALRPQPHDDLADRRGDLRHRGGDLHRQRLRAPAPRARQRRHPPAVLGPARALLARRLHDRCCRSRFCTVLLYRVHDVTGTRRTREGWHSDTVWRARLWIPYLSMPVGLGLLVLQYVVELLCLVTGRTPPFGIGPRQDAP